MTKKDYQALARAIHGVYTRVAEPAEPSPEQTIGFVVDAIANVLQADNPRFDGRRFVEACETGRCKGMPR